MSQKKVKHDPILNRDREQDDSGVLGKGGKVDAIDFNDDYTNPIIREGRVWWNGSEYTLNVDTGVGPVLQVGQEQYVLFYNDTGVQINNGECLHPVGGTVSGGVIVPTVELADASDWEKCQGTLFVATSDVANGSIGFGTSFGKVRGVDTSTLGAGAQIWVSDTTPGAFVNTQPQFPSFVISAGGTLNADPTDGEIFVSFTTRVEDTFINGWDGSIRESFDFLVSSDGATITGTLSNPHATNTKLNLVFSTGLYAFDAPTDGTITLTAGTDTNPQKNYVYIPESTKVLTLSTTGWPDDIEHCKVAFLYLRSASKTQTDDALINQNWNDHVKKDDDNGHILHITERMRQDAAKWDNGVLATCTVAGTPSTVDVSTTAGAVYQLHKQTFPAQNTATGDEVHVVNDSVVPFKDVSDLETITLDANGDTLANRSFSFVLWGVQNKSGEESHIMINLPTGSYLKNNPEAAVNDASNYSVYNIPDEFKSTGFLIARFTYQLESNGTDWTLYDTQDLRGFQPSNAAGGAGGGGGASEFTALTDTPSAYTGEGKKMLFVGESEAGVEFASNAYWDETNVRLGIGTDAPEQILDISGNNILVGADNGTNVRTDGVGKVFRMLIPNTTNSVAPLLAFFATNGFITYGGGSSLGTAATSLRFNTAPDQNTTVGTEQMRITGAGNLGIGTTNPQAKLHVNGGTGSLSTGLAFGDGDSGFYESADDTITMDLGATFPNRWTFTGAAFYGPLATRRAYVSGFTATDTVPVYSFQGDIDTGLGSASDDQISLIAGGVEQLRLTQNDAASDTAYFTGDVGIGTNAPGAALDIETNAGDLYGTIVFETTNAGVLRTNLRASGIQEWYLHSGVAEVGSIQYTTPGGLPGIVFFNTSGTGRSQIKHLTTTGGIGFGAGTGSSDPGAQMVLTTGGDVGIGTTSPSKMLTVGGDGVNGEFLVQANTNSEWFKVEAGNVSFNDQGGYTSVGGAGDLGARMNIGPLSNSGKAALALTGVASPTANIFEVNSIGDLGGDYFVIDKDGQIGIGTTSPSYPLHVDMGDNGSLMVEYDDTATGWGEVAFKDAAASKKWGIGVLADTHSETDRQNGLFFFQYNDKNDTAVSEYRMLIDDSGNVGIGTGAPSERLEVNNTIVFTSEFDNGNSGTADTIDWGAGNKQKSTLTGNVTYTFTAPGGVGNFLLKIVQDATGSRTVTWPASVKWPGGTAPTLSTAANAIDIVTFYYDGTSYYGTSSLAFA